MIRAGGTTRLMSELVLGMTREPRLLVVAGLSVVFAVHVPVLIAATVARWAGPIAGDS